MRVSHFAEIAAAVATFVATYLLFDNQQHFASLSANQVENIRAALEGKSDRLAVKEDEDVEELLFSPKVVRLEKYYRPADGDLNFPKWDQLSYLADYVYSEVPPARKPSDTVLDALKDIPIGTPVEEIKRASEVFGLDFSFMKAVAKIESGFDPKQRTGSYIGLFQLSKYEFSKFGSGQILDPRDNAVAAAYKIITEGILFEWVTHKKPTLSDLYLIHQQGWEGAAQHISHPDRIAWKSMCATSEGVEKGEKWCKRAIWKNTLPAVKNEWKSVDKLTSGAFVGMWRERVAHLYSKYMATAAAERPNQ